MGSQEMQLSEDILCSPDFITPLEQQFRMDFDSTHKETAEAPLPVRSKRPRQGPGGQQHPSSPPCIRNPFLGDSGPTFTGKGSLVIAHCQSRYYVEFHELEEIGRGNFSRVHKVLKRIDGCLYAIKRSRQPLTIAAERERALREVQALACLGPHNNVVRYFSSWLEDDYLYMQLELCDGTLGEWSGRGAEFRVLCAMRKLRHHEQKLLKKVNFLQWKREQSDREALVMRRYHITGRDDYKKYNKICGTVTKLVNIIKKLDPRDPFRIQMTDQLLEKLYNMGVIPSKKSLALCEHLAASALCRRRLAVVLVRLHFAEGLKQAVTFVEQGHIRVGPETITDPAYHVTRNLEDFITWVDTSKIRRKVLQYNDRLDDYDLLD